MQLWVWVCIGAHKGQNSVLDLLESVMHNLMCMLGTELGLLKELQAL